MSLFGESIKNLSPAIFQTLLAHKQSGLPQGQTYRESRLQLSTGHVPSHFNSQRREKWKASSTPEQLFVLFLICGGSSFGKHLPGYLPANPHACSCCDRYRGPSNGSVWRRSEEVRDAHTFLNSLLKPGIIRCLKCHPQTTSQTQQPTKPLHGSVFSTGQQGSRLPPQRERLWGQQHNAGSPALLTGEYNPQRNLIPFWS